MSEKISAMRIFSQFGLDRLGWEVRGVTEDLLDWKYSEGANTIRWLLTHVSEVLNVYFPRALTGDLQYRPEGWPEGYGGAEGLTLEGILRDIEEGRRGLMRRFDELVPSALEEELDWYIGVEKRELYLMILTSEILHHEGQIAAIIGLKKRLS